MYRLVIWHGEHKTLFYVIYVSLENPDDWGVVVTHRTRREALGAVETLNQNRR